MNSSPAFHAPHALCHRNSSAHKKNTVIPAKAGTQRASVREHN
jgi:hypothetical protein